ncbi:hypothetical protein NUK36_07235 [Aeromonas hydrophila]|uniref:ECs_2282 family putative zinc-binding protein n=1 Tax=Aeromonas hydrophila TaxID=644 RepID=UPI00214D4E65|nr:hypothetical protein [Aeromonas hydrophila]MCR3902616.1 hypothetical protein [Aeromonas hydrophila]
MKNDYSTHVTLLCPVCGNSQFESISEWFYRCSDCKTELDKDSLIYQNTESTEAAIKKLHNDFISDLSKKLKNIKGFK